MIDYRARQPEPLPTAADELAALIERNRRTPDIPQQIDAFLGARTIGHGKVRAADLYAAFDSYAAERDWPPYLRPTVAAFGRSLAQRFKRHRDKSSRWYLGVSLA